MDFRLPRYNFIENGASTKLSGLLIDLKIKTPLFITDKDLVRYCLPNSSILFSKDIDTSLINFSNFKSYDGIIGVGGGAALDKARYISFKLKIPFISFATSLSTDAISSSTTPNFDFIKTPVAVIIDLDIINNSPKRLSLAGYGDLMSNITANLDWRLANKERNEAYDEDVSELASGPAYSMLSFVLKNEFNLSNFNQKLSRSLFLSGLSTSLAKNSQPISGSEHLLEKALKSNKKIKISALHGEVVGVSTLLFSHLHELENKEVKGITDKLKASYKKIGAPISFKELGINFEDVLESLLIAHKMSGRYTILRNGLNKNKAIDLLKKF